MEAVENKVEVSAMHTLKHDIKNQLSNIQMLLCQLKYEFKESGQDCSDYLDMIGASAKKIDELINRQG